MVYANDIITYIDNSRIINNALYIMALIYESCIVDEIIYDTFVNKIIYGIFVDEIVNDIFIYDIAV